MEETKTTLEVYQKFQKAVDLIEEKFFTGKGKQSFPRYVLAINTKCKSVVCAFVQNNALFDKSNGDKIQYLGINPRYLAQGNEYVLSTLCHELCHIYENAFIHIPRGGYHDKAWADLMKDCGLEPVYLNKSKTSVNEKIIEGGEFEAFVKDFTEEYGDYFNVVEYSQTVAQGYKDKNPDSDADLSDAPTADNADKPIKVYNRNKIKYECSCGKALWGKGNLYIICGDCSLRMKEVSDVSDRKGQCEL